MSDDDKAKNGSADSGKGDDAEGLNDLLEDWDKAKGKTETKSDNGKSAKATNEDLASEVASLRYEREMEKAIPIVKGDWKGSDKFVEVYIDSRAAEDERLQTLYAERASRKAEWNAALKAMAKDFQKFVGAMDKSDETKDTKGKDADKDDKGLAAAVRAARDGKGTGTDLDGIDWGNLSTVEFEQRKAHVLRLAEAGKLTS